jgi:HSP20 family protein
MTTLTKPQASEISQPENTHQTTYVPRCDIWEDDREVILLADLPGVTPENLDIRFENRELTVHGRVPARQQEGVEFIYGEYGVGDFHRTFTIGEAIDAEKISAEVRNGVLTLHLPKAEKMKPRRIEVKSV